MIARKNQDWRHGLTLNELLVVIAIIGILIALLLPGVQAAREAARKASCSNNLKQIGLALHSYHESHRTLPTGCIEWRGYNSPPTHRQFAWSALLLPYLEQTALHEQIDFGVPFDDPDNAEAAATRLSVYECPTAPVRSFEFGKTDYGGLYGERLVSKEPDTGVFLYEVSIPFKHIFDGLAYTMAVAEDTGGPDSEWINGRNVFVQAHGINDWEAWEGDNEIRSLHEAGAMVLFIDGHCQFLNEGIEDHVLGALITRSGRERIPSSAL